MSYFSRLTDIVTCNLDSLLAGEEDPVAALDQIVGEMEEGLAGARRSVKTAQVAEERIQSELNEHRLEVERWTNQAKTELANNDENAARLALVRKQQAADVIAGLEQQQVAATATREHLTTTLRALEARHAEAVRKLECLHEEETALQVDVSSLEQCEANRVRVADDMSDDRAARVEAELQALKQELDKQ